MPCDYSALGQTAKELFDAARRTDNTFQVSSLKTLNPGEGPGSIVQAGELVKRDPEWGDAAVELVQKGCARHKHGVSYEITNLL